MNNISKKITLLLSVFILIFSLTGCSAKPGASVTGLFDSLKKQDFDTAKTYVDSSNTNTDFKFESEDQKKIINAILSKFEYSIISSSTNGDQATVKVKVTHIDLTRITTKMLSELMPTLFASALSNQQQDKSKQEELFMNYMLNSINDPNAPKTEEEVDIKLVKKDKKWLISPDDKLLQVFTGNLDSLNSLTK